MGDYDDDVVLAPTTPGTHEYAEAPPRPLLAVLVPSPPAPSSTAQGSKHTEIHDRTTERSVRLGEIQGQRRDRR